MPGEIPGVPVRICRWCDFNLVAPVDAPDDDRADNLMLVHVSDAHEDIPEAVAAVECALREREAARV